jgi:hypothetical protein
MAWSPGCEKHHTWKKGSVWLLMTFAVDVGCALICSALWGTCTIIALRSWNDN